MLYLQNSAWKRRMGAEKIYDLRMYSSIETRQQFMLSCIINKIMFLHNISWKQLKTKSIYSNVRGMKFKICFGSNRMIWKQKMCLLLLFFIIEITYVISMNNGVVGIYKVYDTILSVLGIASITLN